MRANSTLQPMGQERLIASPQLENGYTRIANEIIDRLMIENLSAYQWRVLLAIWRKTYGYQKKEDWISNKQLEKMTGIHKANISRTIRELKKRKIVISIDNKLSFNKDYQSWTKKLSRKITVIDLDKKVISRDGHKRKYTKEKKNAVPGFQPALDFYLSRAEEIRGFKPEFTQHDFPMLKSALKKHGEDRVKNHILFFLESEKSEKHISLAAALSADSINAYRLKWQKVKYQYGEDAEIPTGETRWWA